MRYEKIISFLCFLGLSFLILCPCLATTYYLDFTTGLNTNDGLSSDSPWKDFNRIASSNPAPGDVYLFKRGEAWEGGRWYITVSGLEGQVITFGAYGDTNDPLPILSSIGTVDESELASNWTETSPNIWRLSGSTSVSPTRLFLDEVEQLRASTLADLGTADSENVMSYWFYDFVNPTTAYLYIYSDQNPAIKYNSIKGSRSFYSVQIFRGNYLHFENLDIRGGGGAALGMLGATHVTVDNCRLGHSGNSGILLADTDVDGAYQACSNINITNNTFDSNFTFHYGLGSERGCGDGVRMRFGVDHCIVSNNLFINWAHNALELLGDSNDGSGVNDNQIFDNEISAADIPYAHPFGLDGYDGKCQNNEIYRNHIENCRTVSQINGNDNWVHHNIIKGMRNSPSKNSPTAYGFMLAIYGTDLVCKNNRFDHNLIIDTDEAGFIVRGYGDFSNQVTGNSIRNNIIYQTGQSPYNNAYTPGTGLVIYDTSFDNLAGNTYQNNLFYSSIPNAPAVYRQDDVSYFSATEFNLIDGVDDNTISANIFDDPLFTDFDNQEYLPLDNSSAVNAGIDTGLELDYDLQARLIGSAPDIGPFETSVEAPLPVDFGNFDLELIRGEVLLKWETHQEQFSDRFLIERRSNTSPWQIIGTVKAQGNSNQLQYYEFLDQQIPLGESAFYYRLRQVDVDGQFSYSTVISIELPPHEVFSFVRLGASSIQLISETNNDWSDVSIKIYDYSGGLHQTISGTSMIDFPHLSSGAYLLQIENYNQLELIPFLVTKN